jgi:hypothetical protein
VTPREPAIFLQEATDERAELGFPSKPGFYLFTLPALAELAEFASWLANGALGSIDDLIEIAVLHHDDEGMVQVWNPVSGVVFLTQ